MPSPPLNAVWVRLPRFIGDGLMISQALEPLRRAGLPLVAWGPGHVVAVFEGGSAFSAVHADQPGERSAFAMARLFRRHRPRAVMAMGRSTRPLLAGALARVPLRLGWREGGGWLLATRSRSWKDPSRHHIDRYAALVAEGFPGLPEAAPSPFRPGPEAALRASELMRGSGIEEGFVACAIGANSWNKRPGLRAWVRVLDRVKAAGRSAVLLGHGAADAEMAREILAQGAEAHDLVGKCDLAALAGLLRSAHGLLGGDSGLAHLAAAVDCPAVVVFGPTRPEWTAPRGPRVQVFRRDDLACLPCLAPGCAVEGHPCMEELPAERLLALLDEAASRAPADAPK